MKSFSVVLTLALLLTANQLAARMKRAGVLPLATRQATVSHPKHAPAFTQVGLQTFNGSSTNTF